ncbi:MAG: putative periplasmic serine endoprotease DegP-like precursor [Candidatus Hydrogenedentota bacterium]
MRISIPRLILPAALAAVSMAVSGCVTTPGQGGERAVLRAKNEVFPALVHIRPVKEVYASGKRQEVLAIGSGFIISPDGYVVTNEHVAGESRLVQCVLSDKEEVEAVVVGTDRYTDVAVLKLDVGRPLPYVRMGDSDAIEAGNTVIAMGSPHGLSRSVSLGIVSVTDRYLEDGPSSAPFNSWIQTDAAINPGNSGGPLINLKGEVIGVNSRVLRGAENVGFAIPSNIVKEVVEDIIAHGRVRRSWVGIELQETLARTNDASVRGVVIADVDPLSTAAEAGVQPGDLLVAVAGEPVYARFEEDLPVVRKRIADLPVGEPATFTVMRGGEQVDLTITTEERADLKGEEQEFPEWGFTATELTPEIIRRAQLPARQGIFVSGSQVGGLAANARLQGGDIVLDMDGRPIEGLEDFEEQYNLAVESRKPLVMLFVKRGALTRYVLIKQEGMAPPSAEGPPPPDAPIELEVPGNEGGPLDE